MIVGKPQLLKKLNSDIVRDLIYKEGPISKPEIAEKTALSLPTVKKRVDILLEKDGSARPGEAERELGAKPRNMRRTARTR